MKRFVLCFSPAAFCIGLLCGLSIGGYWDDGEVAAAEAEWDIGLVGLKLWEGDMAFVNRWDVVNIVDLPADENNTERTRVELRGHLGVIVVEPNACEVMRLLEGTEKEVKMRKPRTMAEGPIPIITELWALWNVDSKTWAITNDDPPNSTAYLWSDSKEAALDLAKHQRECYAVRTVPVRII